ncbi:hypothetical protein HHI36_017731 [Cryptolaemus montrouzieri]|uniref:Uncharacterized protein n=1 Tax=Cryptolaemus montrouzieri TaxID=559131 RepID=A0ABD2NPZ6_9CUCU
MKISDMFDSVYKHNHLTADIEGGKLRCPAPISRLRVEKIEGGLMVAGVVVANNCQIILPIFGFLFLLVGVVLTAAAYRGPADDEPPRTTQIVFNSLKMLEN